MALFRSLFSVNLGYQKLLHFLFGGYNLSKKKHNINQYILTRKEKPPAILDPISKIFSIFFERSCQFFFAIDKFLVSKNTENNKKKTPKQAAIIFSCIILVFSYLIIPGLLSPVQVL